MLEFSELFLCRPYVSSAHGFNFESDPPPNPTLSKAPEGLGIIAFAFFLDGRGPKAAYRGAWAAKVSEIGRN